MNKKTWVKNLGKKLVELAKEQAFFLLKDTYIDNQLQKKSLSVAKEFFTWSNNLTDDILKNKLRYDKEINRGLSDMHLESLNEKNLDLNISYMMGYEDNIIINNPNFIKFNNQMEIYRDASYKTLLFLLDTFALGFNLNKNLFSSQHEKQSQTLRALHYPKNSDHDNKFHVSPHTDYGTFTLVSQDESAGLMIKLPNGWKWIDIDYSPGVIAVNVADLLVYWCGNTINKNPHSVINSPDKDSEMLFFFGHPNFDATITSIIENRPNKAINSLDYLKMRLNATHK